MSYKEKDIKLLWARSGGKCAFPGCRQDLIMNTTDAIIGNICHIVARRDNGPRADESTTQIERNSYENLILLCPNHHAIVDSDELNYTIEDLKGMKNEHENWVRQRLSLGNPWLCDISQIYYINVPRLSILSASYGIEIDLSLIDSTPDLHSMGFELNKVLLEYERIIERIEPKAYAFDNVSNYSEDYIGATFSFNGKFRTKGIPGPDDCKRGKFSFWGDIDKDPCIYKQYNSFKVVMTIDPRWITTCTAFCNFRPSGGMGTFAGLCTIKDVYVDNRTIVATPLIVGIPKSPLDLFFR